MLKIAINGPDGPTFNINGLNLNIVFIDKISQNVDIYLDKYG